MEYVDPLGERDRNSQADGVGGLKQPCEVVVSHEEARAIRTHCFKDSVAVQKPMVEDRDPGFVVLHKSIVQVNPHPAIQRR